MAAQDQALVNPPRPARPQRATRIGVVASAKRQKSIKVTCARMVRHSKYGKLMARDTVVHAHDEKNEAGAGDTVEIVECRPLSKTKCWRLVRIIRKAPRGGNE